MVKVRLQGTVCELKRMRRLIERNKRVSVVSASEPMSNKGTKKYYRQYIDVVVDSVGEEQKKEAF